MPLAFVYRPPCYIKQRLIVHYLRTIGPRGCYRWEFGVCICLFFLYNVLAFVFLFSYIMLLSEHIFRFCFKGCQGEGVECLTPCVLWLQVEHLFIYTRWPYMPQEAFGFLELYGKNAANDTSVFPA